MMDPLYDTLEIPTHSLLGKIMMSESCSSRHVFVDAALQVIESVRELLVEYDNAVRTYS